VCCSSIRGMPRSNARTCDRVAQMKRGSADRAGAPDALKTRSRGIAVPEARRLLLALPRVAEGRSYGMPSFLVNGRFFARFRDDDTVLVLQLGAIDDRDALMQLDPRTFFLTEHYRNYPAVLIRLAEAPRSLFADVVAEAWRRMAALPPARRRPKPAAGRKRRAR
jgi:hypothetical protein